MIRPSTTYQNPGIDYYSLPFISNSSLTGFTGASEDTLKFGQQLHAAILEPWAYVSDPKSKHKIEEMVKSARRNALLMLMLNDPLKKVEVEYFPIDEETGTQCKLKADLVVGATICDLKTTAAKTREEFNKCAIEYGYHRQGAFYLDGTGKEKFIIFAISKSWPHPTFTFVLTKDEVAAGRAEYERLLANKLNPTEIPF